MIGLEQITQHDFCWAKIVTFSHDKIKMVACNVLEIFISEAAPKIGNNSIKPKQLNVVNTDKTISKRTSSQFPFQTLLTMTPRKVTMSVLCHRKEDINSYHQTPPGAGPEIL